MELETDRELRETGNDNETHKKLEYKTKLEKYKNNKDHDRTCCCTLERPLHCTLLKFVLRPIFILWLSNLSKTVYSSLF